MSIDQVQQNSNVRSKNTRSLKIWVIGTFLIALFLIEVRAGWVSHSAYQRAHKAEQDGQFERAVYLYQMAMRSYGFFFSTSHQASQDLFRLGLDAKKAGHFQHALIAFDHLRGGIWSTFSLFSPFATLEEETNRHLSELRAWQDDPQHSLSSLDAQIIKKHLTFLEKDPRLSPWRSLWLNLSLLGGCICFLLLIIRGLNAQLQCQPPFRFWFSLFSLCALSGIGALWPF